MSLVMPALVAGIQVFPVAASWIAGSSPAMTEYAVPSVLCHINRSIRCGISGMSAGGIG